MSTSLPAPTAPLACPHGLDQICSTFGDIFKYVLPDHSLDPRWQSATGGEERVTPCTFSSARGIDQGLCDIRHSLLLTVSYTLSSGAKLKDPYVHDETQLLPVHPREFVRNPIYTSVSRGIFIAEYFSTSFSHSMDLRNNTDSSACSTGNPTTTFTKRLVGKSKLKGWRGARRLLSSNQRTRNGWT